MDFLDLFFHVIKEFTSKGIFELLAMQAVATNDKHYYLFFGHFMQSPTKNYICYKLVLVSFLPKLLIHPLSILFIQ